MAKAVSIYLSEHVLRRLDAEVERLASEDRARGLSGRKVTNRSQLIERIVEEHLGEQSGLSIEEIRCAVVPIAQQYGAAKVSLFGSYARNEADESSDIDILLDKGSIKGMQVLDFQEELARQLQKPVDVVTTSGASERFLRKIHGDEVTLYEAS